MNSASTALLLGERGFRVTLQSQELSSLVEKGETGDPACPVRTARSLGTSEASHSPKSAFWLSPTGPHTPHRVKCGGRVPAQGQLAAWGCRGSSVQSSCSSRNPGNLTPTDLAGPLPSSADRRNFTL